MNGIEYLFFSPVHVVVLLCGCMFTSVYLHACAGVAYTLTWTCMWRLKLIFDVFLHHSLPLLLMNWEKCSSLVSFAEIKHSSEAIWGMKAFLLVSFGL